MTVLVAIIAYGAILGGWAGTLVWLTRRADRKERERREKQWRL